MPKKTKKHKLQARTNRVQKKIELQDKSFVTPVSSTQLISTGQDKPKDQVVVKTTSAVFSHTSQEKSFFLHDLTKTLMITILIICAQVGLYILQISGTIDISNLISF